MADRMQLVQSIATTIADYRADDGLLARIPRGEAHIERWVNQFEPAAQLPILNELNHVLARTYVSKKDAKTFLIKVCKHDEFADDWRIINFLNIQQGGSSQREMLALFSECLLSSTGLKLDECGSKAGPYIYLDDVVFTGSRVSTDLTTWIKHHAPQSAKVYIVTMAFHRYGKWATSERLKKVCAEAGKSIDIQWRCLLDFENRLKYNANSDVMWPASVPDDACTKSYAATLTKHELKFRTDSRCGERGHFSSPASRHLLEQEFLKGGVRVKNMCPKLKVAHRPLGFSSLETLGFGATVVTFRNCPNNCPLVLWVGSPWYPLFPRKNN